MEKDHQQLSKSLKPRHVEWIALGGTIGTGLFLGAGQTIKSAGPSILLVYLIAGLACFFMMRALGELLVSDPSCDSYIEFITKYLGEKWGFIAGWTYWVCWITIAMAEITAAGLYIQFWFPRIPQWLTGLIVLIILFLLNSVNVSAFGETEFWFAVIKVFAIIALIIIAIFLVIMNYKTNVGHANVSNLTNTTFFGHGINGFLNSFPMVVFSFAGIEMIGMTASETQDPKKELPRSINTVPSRIILFYLGSLLALMCIYPWNHISASSSPFVQVFQNVGIPAAAGIINFVVLTAALSSCNSALFTTGRMLFSLNNENKNRSNLSKRLDTLSKHQVPTFAIGFSTVVIAISVLLNFIMPDGVFSLISSIATTCFLFIWGSVVLAHMKYRKHMIKNNLQDQISFKSPGYPFADYFVLVFFAFVAIVSIFQFNTLIALIGSIIWIIILYFVSIFKYNK